MISPGGLHAASSTVKYSNCRLCMYIVVEIFRHARWIWMSLIFGQIAHVTIFINQLLQWNLRMKDTLGQPFCPLQGGCPLLGSSQCIGTMGRKYLGTSSCVLCGKIVLILKHPLSEIPLYIVQRFTFLGFFRYTTFEAK